jgi:hypothetical protein
MLKFILGEVFLVKNISSLKQRNQIVLKVKNIKFSSTLPFYFTIFDILIDFS